MRNLLSVLAMTLCLTAAISAEVYRVTVTRVDANLYRVEGRPVMYIETQFCYQYAMRDDAVLRYERYGSGNKLIFSDNTTCDVKGMR